MAKWKTTGLESAKFKDLIKKNLSVAEIIEALEEEFEYKNQKELDTIIEDLYTFSSENVDTISKPERELIFNSGKFLSEKSFTPKKPEKKGVETISSKPQPIKRVVVDKKATQSAGKESVHVDTKPSHPTPEPINRVVETPIVEEVVEKVAEKPLEKVSKKLKSAKPTKSTKKTKKTADTTGDTVVDNALQKPTFEKTKAIKSPKSNKFLEVVSKADKIESESNNVVDIASAKEKRAKKEPSPASRMTGDQKFVVDMIKQLTEFSKAQAKQAEVAEEIRHHLQYEALEAKKLSVREVEAKNTADIEAGKSYRAKINTDSEKTVARIHSKNYHAKIKYLSSDEGMALEKDKLKTERKKSNDHLKRVKLATQKAELALEKEKLRSATKEKDNLFKAEQQKRKEQMRKMAEKKRDAEKMHGKVYDTLKEHSPSMAYAYGGGTYLWNKMKDMREKSAADKQLQATKDSDDGDSMLGDIFGGALGGILGKSRFKWLKKLNPKGWFKKGSAAGTVSAGAAAGASQVLPPIGGGSGGSGGGNNPPPNSPNNPQNKNAKSITKLSKVLGKGMPLVGGLVSVIDSLTDGDSFTKALSKGAGATVGGMGGGALGALIGTAVLGPIGTIIGGAIGSIGGALLGDKAGGAAHDGISYLFSTPEEQAAKRGRSLENFSFGQDVGLMSNAELSAVGRNGWRAPPDLTNTKSPELIQKEWDDIKKKNKEDNNPYGINGYSNPDPRTKQPSTQSEDVGATKVRQRNGNPVSGMDIEKIKAYPTFGARYKEGLERYGSDRGGQQKAFKYASIRVKDDMANGVTSVEEKSSAPASRNPDVHKPANPVEAKKRAEAEKAVEDDLTKTPTRSKNGVSTDKSTSPTESVAPPTRKRNTGRTFTPEPKKIPKGVSSGNPTKERTFTPTKPVEPPKRVDNGDGTLSGTDIEKNFIIKQEGLSLSSYADAHGESIGYGHFYTPEEKKRGSVKIGDEYVPIGDKLTKEQADTLLNQDIESHRANAIKGLEGGQDTWNMLNDNQKAALSSYAYNGGRMSTLNKNGFSDAIRRGDTKRAGEILSEFGTRTSKQKEKSTGNFVSKVNPVLVKRRAEEGELFNRPMDSSPSSSDVSKSQPPQSEATMATPEKSVKDGLINAQEAMDNKSARTNKAPKSVNVVSGGSSSTNVNNVNTTYVHAPELDPTIRTYRDNLLFPARV